MTPILLIEPDPILARTLTEGLSAHGCRVSWAREVGESAFLGSNHEAIVLGFAPAHEARWGALRSLLERGSAPVILVGPRETMPEIVRALHSGAEDFLVLPLDPQDLAVRVRAAIRRVAAGTRRPIRIGAIELNPVQRIVSRNGENVALSAHEYIVLALLMTEPGRIWPRGELERQLYGASGGSNIVEVHIHNLRRKLGEHFIRNSRGRGYWVDPDAD